MSLPTLTDVKQELKIKGSDEDALLHAYLQAALRLVEARVGPSKVTEFTQEVNTHAVALNLDKRPVVEVTDLEPLMDAWPAIQVGGLEWDRTSGAVWRRDHGSLAGRWRVTYTAGWSDFPENYRLAALVTVQHLWSANRGGSKRPDLGGVDSAQLRIGSGMTRTIRRDTLTLPAHAEMLVADGPMNLGGIA